MLTITDTDLRKIELDVSLGVCSWLFREIVWVFRLNARRNRQLDN